MVRLLDHHIDYLIDMDDNRDIIDSVYNVKTLTTVLKDPDTIIFDGQGWVHDGHLCDIYACPYNVNDCEGYGSCYYDEYKRCIAEN